MTLLGTGALRTLHAKYGLSVTAIKKAVRGWLSFPIPQ